MTDRIYVILFNYFFMIIHIIKVCIRTKKYITYEDKCVFYWRSVKKIFCLNLQVNCKNLKFHHSCLRRCFIFSNAFNLERIGERIYKKLWEKSSNLILRLYSHYIIPNNLYRLKIFSNPPSWINLYINFQLFDRLINAGFHHFSNHYFVHMRNSKLKLMDASNFT